MNRLRRRLITFLAALVLFLLGNVVALGLYPPQIAPPATPIPALPQGVTITPRVQTRADVERVRGELWRFLFGDLPPTAADCAGDACTVTMQYGVQSLIDVRQPQTSNGSLFIYHNGHGAETPDDTRVIDALLGAGYAVAVFDMPLLGVNPTPTIELPVFGALRLTQHNHFDFMEGMVSGSPVRYFLEPVIALLNAVREDYQHVYMTGISGGGWTTTWAAALDTRIDASYPTAGSLPIGVHFAINSPVGDYEQFVPALYAIADYADLYVMGAAGRRQVQFLNYYDPCCFSGDHRTAYEPAVAALAAQLGGSFAAHVDYQNHAHTLSPSALSVLLADL